MKIVQGTNGALIPISPAVRSGGFIILSGQLALREGRIVGQTIEEQTDVVIGNIEDLLAHWGKGLKDVVKTTAWLTRSVDFAGFNAAYARRFLLPFPARSTVVAQLLIPEALVEVEAIVSAELCRSSC